MYLSLFNSITDAIELLKCAQMKSEELYIKADDDVLVLSVFEGEGEATSKPNANV